MNAHVPGASTGSLVEATAPASALAGKPGTRHQVFRGGQLWVSGVNIPVLGIDRDADGQPVANIMFAKGGAKVTPPVLSLHVGESVTVPDVGTVTLVSFDIAHGAQAITFLVDIDPSATAAPAQ